MPPEPPPELGLKYVLSGFAVAFGVTTLLIFEDTLAFLDIFTTLPETCEPVIVTSPLT